MWPYPDRDYLISLLPPEKRPVFKKYKNIPLFKKENGFGYKLMGSLRLIQTTYREASNKYYVGYGFDTQARTMYNNSFGYVTSEDDSIKKIKDHELKDYYVLVATQLVVDLKPF